MEVAILWDRRGVVLELFSLGDMNMDFSPLGESICGVNFHDMQFGVWGIVLSLALYCCCKGSRSMIRKNRQLVTNEPVEFEK